MAVIINGNGVITAEGTTTSQGQVVLGEDTDNGTNTVTLQAPPSLAANLTFTLPNADGTTGQVIQTNGSGTLSFVSIVGGAQAFVTQLNGGNVAPTQNADSAALI
jgi:hypothetical protein